MTLQTFVQKHLFIKNVATLIDHRRSLLRWLIEAARRLRPIGVLGKKFFFARE